MLLATLLAASASRWWLGDLAVHFRLQYAALALIALVVLVWARSWSWAAASLLTLIVNLAAAASILGPMPDFVAAGHAAAPHPTNVRIVALNVFYHNSQYERALTFVRAARPDVVVLVEITPQWRSAFERLRAAYPFQYYAAAPRPLAFGSSEVRGALLLSRWPIVHAEQLALGPTTDPAVTAVLAVQGRDVRIIGVHAAWPLGLSVSGERNEELVALATRVRSETEPCIVAGDFNVTPFSPYFRRFLAASGLVWAAQGAGWQPTWPTFLPPAGIQIDHVFVSPGIQVQRFARGPSVGSDHRPILADLVIPGTRGRL
ncbi:MAG TPA: endonuclease/exonuclease/phosphatase family protein [Steroidobacteraceae bacterium]|nr:endonuclease/exonuclease/phosphatase family protein [Steroidobacteraceae bacterium]